MTKSNLLPLGAGGSGGGGGGGGTSTKQVTLSDVPTIFRQAVLQPGKDHYNVTTTWRDLRTGRTEVLNTGTAVEIGPVQIGNLADFVEIFGTGVVYCGSHTTPAGIGVEQKFQYAKADTESGTYSAYADIDESTFSSISGGTITFRSKIAAGGAGGRAFADYMPATQVASTWEDMGFAAADVGKWIKIIVLHKKPSSDHPDIEQRYGWRLTLKVDSEVDKTVAVTFAGAKEASEIATATADFGGNIPVASDTVQKALDALDDLTVVGGGAALSDDDPIVEGTAAPGTAATASRSDHVHPSGGVVGGGGGGEVSGTATSALTPTELYAEAAVAGGWQELTLLEDLPTEGALIEFRVSPSGAGPGEYALATAVAIASTTEASSTPSGIAGALPIKTMEATSNSFGHDTILIQKSDEANKIWVRTGRSFAGSWEIKSFTVTTALTLEGAGGGGSYLPSLDDTPSGVADDGLWNRRGLFVQEHIKQLADSTRAFTSFDLSTPFVSVDSKLIGNVNRPGNWLGLFLEDEHAADGVRRPAAASNNAQFGLNAANGHFEKSNGTDWLEYDPFATGEPWENAYPYGAYSDRTYTTGVKDGRGFRVTMTGKLGVQIGENGNDWETRITADATITAASKVVISAESTPLSKVLTITVKTMDGGDDTPTIVAVVAALNSFQPGGVLAGFLVTAGYIGYVLFTDKLDSSDAGGTFAPGSIDFAGGSAGTEGVPLTHLDYWAETKTELDESWSAVGQVGLDFSGGDLHAVTAYTAPEAGGTEETIKIYRPPGYRQVVPIGRDDIRPKPSDATLGQALPRLLPSDGDVRQREAGCGDRCGRDGHGIH